MAFALDFETCQQNSCEELVITDTSTDWGSSTIPIGTPGTYVLIIIEDSAGNTETWDVSAVFIAATVQADLVYTSSDYSTETYADGAYTITYEIYTSSSAPTATYTKEKDQYFICQISCCVDSMLKSIPEHYDCDSCDDEYIRKALDSYGIFLALENEAARCNISKADSLYDILDELCDWENCDCT